MKRISTIAAALLLAASSAHAQTTADIEAARERLRAILNLPTRADEVREAGAPDSTVRTILDILRERNTPATDAEEVLTTQRDAVREHGPVDNFGAFVQAQLANGLRGRELAAAIRAEHQARGKGKPAGLGVEPSAAGRGRAGAAAGRGGPPDSTAAGRGRADSGRAAGKANPKRPN